MMMKKQKLIAEVCCAWLTVGLLLLGGCNSNSYEIEMRTEGKSIHRQLTCWREDQQEGQTRLLLFPEEQLKHIAKVYGQPLPARQAKKHTFAGKFTGKTPQDVGGDGSFTRWTTPLGSVSLYLERFRGHDEPDVDIQRRQEAAGRIADLLLQWLESELATEAQFEELREFLDNNLRRDISNLAIYSWAYELASTYQDNAEDEWVMRIGQYLVERDYFTPERLPMLVRAVEDTGRGEPGRLLALVQRIVASKMGVADDQPIPKSLEFLGDAQKLTSSLNRQMRTTDEFRELIKQWEANRADDPMTPKPKPQEVLEELALKAFLPNFQIFMPSDRLSVRLAASSEPVTTNGQWDENAGQISWSATIPPFDSKQLEFPTLLYAIWSEPDATFQKKHFGKLVLDRDELGTYCIWYLGLSPQEAGQWDAFILSLKGTDDIAKRIKAFRFSGEPAPSDEDDADTADTLSATARDLLLSALSDQDQ